jgi:uncharacterized membrane-anchored protein
MAVEEAESRQRGADIAFNAGELSAMRGAATMIDDNVLSPEVQELLQAAGVEVAYTPDKDEAYHWMGPGGRGGVADTRFEAAQEALTALRRLAEEHPVARLPR